MEMIVFTFLYESPFAQEVKRFFYNEDCLRNETNVELLAYLCELGSVFEYEQMYLESYAAMIKLGHPTEPLSIFGYNYSDQEILDWEWSGISGLFTLVAEDGSR